METREGNIYDGMNHKQAFTKYLTSNRVYFQQITFLHHNANPFKQSEFGGRKLKQKKHTRAPVLGVKEFHFFVIFQIPDSTCPLSKPLTLVWNYLT